MFGKIGKLNKCSVKIKQVDLITGKVIKIWNAMADVERELGISHSSISNACNGRYKTSGGFKWEYL